MNVDDRLTEAETKLAYLESTVDTLNDVIVRQRDQLDALERRLERLQGELDAAALGSPADDKPPHY